MSNAAQNPDGSSAMLQVRVVHSKCGSPECFLFVSASRISGMGSADQNLDGSSAMLQVRMVVLLMCYYPECLVWMPQSGPL